MNPDMKLKEIEERWKAFRHWMSKVVNEETTQYKDSAGPDVEWLIDRVKQLEIQLNQCEQGWAALRYEVRHNQAGSKPAEGK